MTGARGAVVKFTGDDALATFDGPARAINCACAIRDAVEDLGLTIRAGLHTGEVEMADGDVHGIAVHIAARIMALAAPGEVLVSGAIPPLVLGSRIAFPSAAATNSRACRTGGRPRGARRPCLTRSGPTNPR
ncbi:MAG: adenylate/guanylate cyclase domain-containing protein [Mycobacterium sp.]|uniref:adenylate/guanylate cyclase domain-containing protein n=1 Tax=Mycobacterium sp. TaxID=1785 RepID=UPI003C70871D